MSHDHCQNFGRSKHYSLHVHVLCDQIDRHQHREIGQAAQHMS